MKPRSHVVNPILMLILLIASNVIAASSAIKPSPDECLAKLQAGNERFISGQSQHPHTDSARLTQAGRENQGDHAFATVITCSDSRVPIERVFDAGIMDLFVIRVAGNVCDTDEIGSIEYGLAHVNTPVLVVLGHTQCGAVTAVTEVVQGHNHSFERNIPPLVDNIEPAVRRAMKTHENGDQADLIATGIVENVWQSIEDLFRESPATRQLVQAGKVKVVGAIYDVGTGRVHWQPASKPQQILAQVEADPHKATEVFAAATTSRQSSSGGGGHGVSASDHTSTDDHAGAHASTVIPSSKFNEPELAVANRPAWGASAGHFEPYHVLKSTDSDNLLVVSFWIATGLAVIVTIGLAFKNSKIRGSDGVDRRGFTLGTKLVLGFGVLASMIMLVSTLSLWAQNTSSHKAHEFSDIVSHAQLVESLQRDVLMIRLKVKNFLITNSDHDLKEYSNYLAAAKDKLKACQKVIHNPTQVAMIDQIHTAMAKYESTFSTMVTTIDQRNAVMNSQLNPTADRAVKLIEEIMHTAHTDGNLQVALEAAETDAELNQAQSATLKYFISSDVKDQQIADEHLRKAEQIFTELEHDVNDAHRRACLMEAKQAFVFYADKLHSTVALVDQSNDLVENTLEVIGTKIASSGTELLESIVQSEKEIHKANEATAKATVTQAVTSSVLALVIAVFTGMFLIRSITASINKVLFVLRKVSQGDLTNEPLNMTSTDEMGSLGRATDQMSVALKNLLMEVNSSSSDVASAASEIAASSEEMANGMHDQSQRVMQVSSAIEEMSASVVEVARKSNDASTSATEAGKVAGEGGMVVQETIDGMNAISEAVTSGATSVGELGKRSEQIGQIIEVINDIADQTNLLALNAAIEAARAGEHGRGFAVVADEVRKLADRTTKATQEIADSIQAIQVETNQAVERMNMGTKQVKTGVEKASSAGENLRLIVASAQDVAGMIQSIAAAAEEQSAASEEISSNINSISSVTNQTNEAATQSSQAASQLSLKADQLRTLVSKFKF